MPLLCEVLLKGVMYINMQWFLVLMPLVLE